MPRVNHLFLVLTALLASGTVARLGSGGSGTAARAAGGSAATGRFLVTVGREPAAFPARLEVVGGDGGVIRLVSGEVGSAALSPNHTLIAWTGTNGIHVGSVRSPKGRLLVRFHCPAKAKGVNVCGGSFVWSPDNRKLLFVAPDQGLDVATLATGARRRVVAPKKHVSYDPIAWSGPARELLFTTDDEGGANGIGCCSQTLDTIRPAAGNHPHIVYKAVDPIHDGAAAAWSPNGKWISFTTDGRDPHDPRLAVVNAKTGATKRVRNYNGFTEPPVWSPDSARIATGGYQSPLVIFSSSGTPVTTLQTTGADVRAWTRNGIYFLPNDNPRKLLLIRTGQQAPSTVFTLPAGQVLLAIQPI